MASKTPAAKKAAAKKAAATAPAAKKGPARYQKNTFNIGTEKVEVYATPKLGHALTEITKDMGLYEGVKFEQILQALYQQGKKDGAREVIETVSAKMEEVQAAIPHRNPGAPKGKR